MAKALVAWMMLAAPLSPQQLKFQHRISLDLGSLTRSGLVSSPAIDCSVSLINYLGLDLTLTGPFSPDWSIL